MRFALPRHHANSGVISIFWGTSRNLQDGQTHRAPSEISHKPILRERLAASVPPPGLLGYNHSSGASHCLAARRL